MRTLINTDAPAWQIADDCALSDGLVITMRHLTGAALVKAHEVRTLQWLKARNAEEYDRCIRNACEDIDKLVKAKVKHD